jgi:glycerol-3-phosphate dehydrogenase (NAD(P)+)
MRIAVIGAGSWGTTLANLLVHAGHDVRIWAYETEVVESINREHTNALFLAGCPLERQLEASEDLGHVVTDVDLIVSATPSHVTRGVAEQARAVLNGSAIPPIVCVSKGLESESYKTMTAVLGESIPGTRLVALSGPSFAQEVYRRDPTAVVAASDDAEAAQLVQQAFTTGHFRVYTSTDVVGVQLGGALKNVIAIAAGMLHGLELGHNSLAALITRGLAEMSRLGVALGADPLTFAGLAGMGDLVLTATGALSRNRTLGVELAQGRSLAEIMGDRRTVAEGVRTAQAAVELGQRTGVELPIATEVERILFEDKSPRQAVRDLMEREPKPENWR